jgi:long-subunit acyl-CoA synthetase (AMP-forming)
MSDAWRAKVGSDSKVAAGMAGMVLVTVDPAFRARKIEYVLKQSRSSGVFVVSAFRGNPMLEIVRGGCPKLPRTSPNHLP